MERRNFHSTTTEDGFKEKMPSRSICLVTGESGLMSMAGKHLLELLTER